VNEACSGHKASPAFPTTVTATALKKKKKKKTNSKFAGHVCEITSASETTSTHTLMGLKRTDYT